MNLQPGNQLTYRARGKGRLLHAKVIDGPPRSNGIGDYQQRAWPCHKDKAELRRAGESPLVYVPEHWIVAVQ